MARVSHRGGTLHNCFCYSFSFQGGPREAFGHRSQVTVCSGLFPASQCPRQASGLDKATAHSVSVSNQQRFPAPGIRNTTQTTGLVSFVVALKDQGEKMTSIPFTREIFFLCFTVSRLRSLKVSRALATVQVRRLHRFVLSS